MEKVAERFESIGIAALLVLVEGGVAELIGGSGAGMTFDAGEVGSLSEVAITALKRSDLHCLGLLGRSYAEREHAWSLTFDRLFAVYRELVA